MSSLDACIASVCTGLEISLDDAVLAADIWNHVLEHTAGDNWPMGPGHTSFLLAQLVWGSVFLDYLSTYFLIPSCNINAISEAYERHLRKPRSGQKAHLFFSARLYLTSEPILNQFVQEKTFYYQS